MGKFSGKKCRLLSMLWLTTAFFFVEIAVGYITNSMSLVADSFHMLSDVAALIVAFLSVKMSPKKWSKNTFGWARAEVLGALVNAVFLVALCFSITVEACKRFIEVDTIHNPQLLLIVGGLGLLVNVIGLFLFHDCIINVRSMEALLTLWGFGDYVEVFKEQDIDEEALLQLDMNTLKELVPKIGPRVKIFARLAEYKELMGSPIIISDVINDENETETSAEAAKGSITKSSSPSPSTSSTSSLDVNKSRDEVEAAFRSSTKRQMAFSGQAMLKKACRTVYHLDLRQFLDKTVTGKFIVNSYAREKRFTRKMRGQLSYIVVSGLMSENSDLLSPLDFEILSEKICELFPTETKSTYYIPRIPGSKTTKPVNPKGKLIDKYRNLRRMYNLPEGEDGGDTLSENHELANIPDIDELNNCAAWLKTEQEPWNSVLQKWEKTFPLRKIANKVGGTVEDYMREWPILKHRKAYALINYDFKQLHPDCSITSLFIEYQKWEKFFNTMKTILTPDIIIDEWLSPLDSEISQDHGSAHGHSHSNKSAPPVARLSRSRNRLTQLALTDDNENDESYPGPPPQTEKDEASHGHSHSSAQMNMRGVFLHVLSDALGSVIVCISALVYWLTDWKYKYYIDPALSIILVLLIMHSVWPLLRDSALILLQTVPTHIQVDAIQTRLLNKVDGVLAVHEFHVWQLAGDRIIASAHITCRNLSEYMRIAENVKEFFHNEGIHSTTIQPEFIDYNFMDKSDETEKNDDCALDCPKTTDSDTCVLNTCCGPSKQGRETPSPNNTPYMVRQRGAGNTQEMNEMEQGVLLERGNNSKDFDQNGCNGVIGFKFQDVKGISSDF